jgi:hypothetical protein
LLVDLKGVDESDAEHWFGHGCRLEVFISGCVRIKDVAVVLAIKVEGIAV